VDLRPVDEPLHAHLEAGDLRAAGTWLVERFADQVLGLCRAMVRDPNMAEDLTQEVFGRAFAALAGFRGESSARTWLLAIARNRCIDHLRSTQRDPWRDDDGSEPDEHPDDAPLAPDLLARQREVQSALEGLAEGERALVVLRYRHGLDYRELALVFGLREGTVRMRLSRALGRMRGRLVAARRSLGAPPPARRPAQPEPVAQRPPVPPAPAPAPPRAAPPPPPRAAAPMSRSLGAGPPPAPGGAPAPDPLGLVLARLDPGLPGGLQRRLLAAAGAL